MTKKLRFLIAVFICLGCLLIFINLLATSEVGTYLPSTINENRAGSWNRITVTNVLDDNSEKQEDFNSEAQPTQPSETPINPEGLFNISQPIKSLLLLSSVGRSGSSFLGELLASQKNNIYFYEPIRALPRVTHTKGIVQFELLRNFLCQISSKLLDIGKTPDVTIRHPTTFGKRRSSLTMATVQRGCQQEQLRIIKTIRTRLEWTKKLLADENLNLKVIHLVRDPRGSFISMDILNWKMSTKEMCQRITEDLLQRKEMERLYPGRYYFIKYEDFCRNPYGKTSEIFRFLRGDDITSSGMNESLSFDTNQTLGPESFPDLPKSVFTYLSSHIHVNMFSKKSPWTTVRDTSSHYQKWRYRISQEELLEVEGQCQEVLNILGYRTFGSLRNARNFSLSLFT